MAKDKLTEYDSTAANNTVVGDVNLAENSCLPSDMNNAIREVMSHLKDFSDGSEAISAIAVDNLKLDGNTLSSTDTNGNIVVDPDGTGVVQLGSELDTNGNAVRFGASKWTIELDSGDDDLNFKYNGTTVFKLASNGAVTSANDVTAFGSP